MAQQLPAQHIAKADQWVLLSYNHAARIMHLLHYLYLADHSSTSTVETTVHNDRQNSNGAATDALAAASSESSSATTEEVVRALSARRVQESPVWQLFEGVRASDEMLFPTLLSVLG